MHRERVALTAPLLALARHSRWQGGAEFLNELQHADSDELVALLKDKMLRWWSINSLLPAAVLGIRGRALARERRAAVDVVHFHAKMWAAMRRLRRLRRIATTLARRRRGVLWNRLGKAMRLASLRINAAARTRLATKRYARLKNAATELELAAWMPAKDLDLGTLAAAIRVAEEAHVGGGKVEAARAKHEAVAKQRQQAAACMREAASAPRARVDTLALAAAVEEARRAGLGAADIAEAQTVYERTVAARSEAQAVLTELAALGAVELRLGALREAIDVSTQVGVAEAAIAEAEATLQRVSSARDAAAARLEEAAAPSAASLNLEQLGEALSEAEKVGVEPAAREAAQRHLVHTRTLREDAGRELSTLLDIVPAALELHALREGIDAAVLAGVAEGAISVGEARYAQVVGLRESATAQLQTAMAPAAAQLDVDALEAALMIAATAGVNAATLGDAEAQLEAVRTGRQAAGTALTAATAVTPALMDLDTLRVCVANAIEAGVPSAEVEEAESALARVAQLREEAEATLVDACWKPSRDFDPVAVEAAAEAATEVGVLRAAIERAQQRLRRIRTLRNDALTALDGALEPPPRLLNLTALALAIDQAAEAGCDPERVEAAQASHDGLQARRETARNGLTALCALSSPRLDLTALDAALDEAREAGLEAASIEAAAATRSTVHHERDRASAALQAVARRRAAERQLAEALRATVRLQAACRRMRIFEIFSEVSLACRMLRSGNIFVKFSHNGPPHDRWIWCDDAMRAMQWADPEKRKKGQLKGMDATIMLDDITAISEGSTSEVGKHHSSSFLQSIRGWKTGASGLKKLDQDCCLTVLAKGRSLDLQAPSKLVRRDWLLALRLVLTMRNLSSLERLEDRKRIREFIRVKPRRRTRSAGSTFANFFGARARGASVLVRKSLSDASSDGANAAGAGAGLAGSASAKT